MSLEFYSEPSGDFLIVEKIMSFTDTQVKSVRYNSELTQIRVNDDPWRDLTPESKAWFERHYRDKFDAIKNSSLKPAMA